MTRPSWSGQIQISLVSFGVKLFPATEAKSEIHFHQIDRKTGERVRHRNVSESDKAPIEKEDIVKGYEYRKGQYIQIDPSEIEHLRIPSKHSLQIEQFVDLDAIDPALFERPYFLLPEKETDAAPFGVIRVALEETGKAGLGKVAMGGREHLMAIAATPDRKLAGLMAYTLRYAAELRSAREYLSDVKRPAIDKEQLSLAKELIQRKAGKFDPAKFTDSYETALQELGEAKLKHAPLPLEEKPARRAKVINLMDALRRSVQSPEENKEPGRAAKARTGRAGRNKLAVMPSRPRHTEKRRKSA